jgi:GNAT superfamily N-acetyltransferase
MTGAEIVERNLVEFFRHVARVRPSGSVAELDGVTVASAGIEFYMFNAAFLSRPVAEGPVGLDERISLAQGHLRAQGRRWAFWACEERFAEGLTRKARATFERRGLAFAYRHPGMICPALPRTTGPRASLDIRPVKDRESRLAFSHINSVAFRIPFEWCLELYDLEQLWGGDFEGWIGYAGGEAVSTAATLVAEGAAGVYAVATLPGYRRKGFAEAMVRHAAARVEASRGIRLSILQSTEEAVPLYKRMGYRTVTNFSVFST